MVIGDHNECIKKFILHMYAVVIKTALKSPCKTVLEDQTASYSKVHRLDQSNIEFGTGQMWICIN